MTPSHGAAAGLGRQLFSHRHARNEASPRTPAPTTPGRAGDNAEETDRLAIRMIEVETSLSEIKDSMMTEAKMKGMMKDLVA